MPVTINGTTGIAGVDGSASTPAVQGSDTNTGIFFGTDTVTIATGGTAAVTVDSGQRTKFPTTIGVGGATPSTSGSGISFPATQSASTDANTLDDYEEGTWTPSVGGTATYTTQSGKYRKIGSLVFIDCELNINTIGTGSVSNITGGLPFTPASGGGSSGGTVAYASGLNTNLVFLSFRVDPGSATIYNAGMTAAAATTTDGVSIFKNGARVLFSITYIAS